MLVLLPSLNRGTTRPTFNLSGKTPTFMLSLKSSDKSGEITWEIFLNTAIGMLFTDDFLFLKFLIILKTSWDVVPMKLKLLTHLDPK